jgi:phosphoglycolate phosphatase
LKPIIKAILFDKDGTLLDYHLSWGPLNQQVALYAARGDGALADRILAATGYDFQTGKVISGTLLAAGTTHEIASGFIAAGSTYGIDELTIAVDGIFRSGVASVVPVTDLAPFFMRLKRRGLVLGIASSDSAAAIHMTAERFHFVQDVDFIAGWDSGHGAKPSSGMLDAFVAHSRLAPREIAVVGDNLHDMEMATAGGAGLRVGVLTGTSSRAELAPACDLCLDSILDLEVALFGG